MTKWLENAEGAQDWLKKESERLGKMLSKKGSLAGKKLDELQMRQNVHGFLHFSFELAGRSEVQ